MRRFKQWLLERFLPAWAKDSVYRENAALRAQLNKRDQQIRELQSYIDGLEAAMRSSRQRIIIQGGVRP